MELMKDKLKEAKKDIKDTFDNAKDEVAEKIDELQEKANEVKAEVLSFKAKVGLKFKELCNFVVARSGNIIKMATSKKYVAVLIGAAVLGATHPVALMALLALAMILNTFEKRGYQKVDAAKADLAAREEETKFANISKEIMDK